MKKTLLLLWLSALSLSLFPQENQLDKYMSSITASELSEHVHTLASPDFEGRSPGSEGMKLAAEYIRDQFAGSGLTGAFSDGGITYFQDFTLDNCYWKNQQISSGKHTYSPANDFLFLSDPSTMNGSYQLVFAGYGIDDSVWSDYENLDVEGKVVLALSGEPKDENGVYLVSGSIERSRKSYYFSKIRAAREKGAEGLMLISREDKSYREYVKERGDYYTRGDVRYPGSETQDDFFTIYVRPGIGARLLNTSQAKMKAAIKEMEQEEHTLAGSFQGQVGISTESKCESIHAHNIAGYIQGSDLKSEAIVVLAHYDHLGIRNGKTYYGADDNASGCAAVLELAEAFAKASEDGLSPRRSVIFMTVSSEELGLLGSRYYSENPFISLDSTVACVNIDMIGRVDKKYGDTSNYIGGMVYNSEEILETARRNASVAAPDLEFRMTYQEHVRGGSDHYYFARNGIPSLFYFNGIHEDYHEPTDTADKLLYDRMEATVRSIFLTVWELANNE